MIQWDSDQSNPWPYTSSTRAESDLSSGVELQKLASAGEGPGGYLCRCRSCLSSCRRWRSVCAAMCRRALLVRPRHHVNRERNAEGRIVADHDAWVVAKPTVAGPPVPARTCGLGVKCYSARLRHARPAPPRSRALRPTPHLDLRGTGVISGRYEVLTCITVCITERAVTARTGS